MSMKRISPTANLLRTSRLFSLPPPLPRPTADNAGAIEFTSETATLPHPTHAAIETSSSSLGRGDWGLKRPLPLKSTTRTSTPAIHIDNVDSIDHITDFDSASDHTRTLQKWQEMDLPISMIEAKRKASGGAFYSRSVFESQHDNTESLGANGMQTRWKFKGPWLAGKTDGEFDEYVAREVKKRKVDFRPFLAGRLARQKMKDKRRQMIESGEGSENLDQLLGEEAKVSDSEIDQAMRRLRKDETLLHQLIEEFLDLPRQQRTSGIDSEGYIYLERGPPKTHPSAGLSYLRTASHTFNHPTFGPQLDKSPIECRVVRPQFHDGIKSAHAFLGVGGVIAEDKDFLFTKNDPGTTPETIVKYDPDIPGGGKTYIHPVRAAIDPKGRIELNVKRATTNAVNVMKGANQAEERLPLAAVAAARDRETPDLTRPTKLRERHGYGLDIMGGIGNAGRAQPFGGPGEEEPDMASILQNFPGQTKSKI